MSTTISRNQLDELVSRTRTVLNAANEAAENGNIPDEDADFVEEQLAPVFQAAQREQERLNALSTPSPAPVEVRPSRTRY